MGQNAVGRCPAGGGLQVPSGPWIMQRICSLSVLVLHGTLLVPVLMYGFDTMLQGEGEI